MWIFFVSKCTKHADGHLQNKKVPGRNSQIPVQRGGSSSNADGEIGQEGRGEGKGKVGEGASSNAARRTFQGTKPGTFHFYDGEFKLW